jgi:hypothetical protein
VRLEKDGYSERRFRAELRPGSVLELSVELKEAVGKVLLRIQPAQSATEGAPKLPLNPHIRVDGQYYPGPALELASGYRTIQVRAFGWEELSTTVYVEDNSQKELELNLKPAAFKLSDAGLSRGRFNPANAGSLGTTAFNFEVSGPGKGTFYVLDAKGAAVFSRPLDPFETWSQSLVWDGRNSRGEAAEDGVYTLVVTALSWDDSAEERLALEAVIDSSRIIYPLTMSSGKSGLLFASLPSLLPPGSFQIEGNLLAGSPPFSDGLWSSLPFSAAFRFSPLYSLEVSAALNVMPRFEDGTKGSDVSAGAAGAVKWVFLNPAASSLGAAAGLAFSWAGEIPLSPFGMASGIEVFFPLSFDLGIFTLTLSPACLWTSDDVFWYPDPVPRLLVSGGLMMKMTYLSAGLSVRSEFNFSTGPWPLPFMAGAELKFFPPPSSFVFSFLGGIWGRDSAIKGFCGLGIGMIY